MKNFRRRNVALHRAGKKKLPVTCKCKCLACGEIFFEERTDLDPDKTNYIYCEKDRKNRLRDPEGFSHKNTDDPNNPKDQEDIDDEEVEEEVV